MIIVRYADDIIVDFEYESAARRFWDAMRERLGEFALSLHPDKTRLIEFGRFAAAGTRKSVDPAYKVARSGVRAAETSGRIRQ
jgi:RNA-directed DNA polymerase